MRTASPERLSEILDAACRVICERGADALRMQDVADCAGVSRALLHYHYANRADLLRRAFEHADSAVDRHIEAVLEGASSPRERLKRLLSAYLDDDPTVRMNWSVWFEMRRAALYDPTLRPAVDESWDSWIDQVAGLLEACGPLDDSRSGATRLCALVDGLGEQRLARRLSYGEARDLVLRALDSELAR